MIVPSLVYDDAAAAIDWLTRAFGFELRFRVDGADGDVLYAELWCADGFLMVETAPDNDLGLASPAQLGRRTSGVCLTLDSDAIEAHAERAVAHGAVVVRELAQLEHGRQYSVLDCEGQLWTFTTYVPGSATT